MKAGGRIAVGVGTGYLLGRTRKMKLALAIAAAGATGTTSPRKMVQRGLKQLAESAEVGKLTEAARGELVNAAKAAAVTAASSRIDALSERLAEPGRVVEEAGEAVPKHRKPESAEGGEEENKARDGEGEEDEAQGEKAPDEDEAQGEKGEGEEAPDEGRKAPARPTVHHRTPPRTTPRRRQAQASAGEESTPRRVAGAGTGRAPVRRTRR